MQSSPQRIAVIGFTLLLFGAVFITAQSGQSIQDLSQEAKNRENLGDYEGAIRVYERIVQNFSSQADRPLVARATLQLGILWLRLADAKGRTYLQQVIEKYGDEQPQLVAQARELLNLAGRPSPPIQIATPYTNDPFAFAISPDGNMLVFQVALGGKEQLWIENIDTRQARAIAGAEGSRVQYPFWSPDSLHIGFFADGKLKRISVEGGIAQELADARDPYGGTWGSRGVIVFAPYSKGPLFSVKAGGGEPNVATKLLDRATSDRFPRFLADGRRFVYFTTALADQVVSVGSVDSLESKVISRNSQPPRGPGTGLDTAASYVFSMPPAGTFAQRLDLETMTLTGARPRVADQVAVIRPGIGVAAFSASTRRLAYRVPPVYQKRMVWMNRMGQQIGSVVGDAANITDAERIRIAPDGRSVAVFRFNPVSHSIWQIDVITGSMRVVGENAGPGRTDGTPVWSPDGAFIAYENFAAGFFNLSLYSSPVGPGEITQLLSLLEDQKPNDWMENGHGDQFLLYEKSGYENSGRQTGWDLMVLPLDGKQTPIPIAATQARESNGRFAPNGKWIAYESSEAGKRKEIYVQPFPGTVDMRQKISALGGSEPRWRRDGSELYYIAPDNRLTAVPVKFSPNGESITLGRPTPLFSTPIPNGAEYEPHPDGQRFLLNAPTEGLPPVAPILVLSDWMSRLPNSGAAPAVPSPPGAGGNSRP